MALSAAHTKIHTCHLHRHFNPVVYAVLSFAHGNIFRTLQKSTIKQPQTRMLRGPNLSKSKSPLSAMGGYNSNTQMPILSDACRAEITA